MSENIRSLAFKKDMINVPFDEIKYISSDANDMWNLWKRFFLDILNKHAPITNIQVKGSKIPYVTSELKSMIRQRLLKGLRQIRLAQVCSGKHMAR